MKNLIVLTLICLFALPAFAIFSVDLPIVTHAVGATATFYTSMDVTNNSNQTTGVNYEYVSSDLAVDVRGTLVAALGPHGNFHTDDVLGVLASQGAITSAQATNGFGTLLLTFMNPAFTTGNEASVTVRIYNYLSAGQKPSVGLAYRGVVLRKNGSHSLSTVISNTTGLTDNTPAVVTNLGLENVGINDNGDGDATPVNLQLTFYDPATGNQVGPQPTVTLGQGQVTQLNDLWSRYSLPASATSLLVTVAETSGTAQIRGYVSVKDVSTNDGSFFFMQ
jgi:hypothetical protein